MRYITKILFLAFVISTTICFQAHSQMVTQIQYQGYIQQVAKMINQRKLSYNYQVTVFGKNNKSLEQVQGRIYKDADRYLDSNSYTLSMVADGHFIKLDYQKKQAHIYNLSSIERTTGLKQADMITSVIDIPDSSMLKLGYLTAKEHGEFVDLTYKLKESLGTINEIRFKLRIANMSLCEIRIMSSSNDSPETFVVYTLQDFTNVFDTQLLRSSRYFRLEEKKFKLIGKYQSYKINTIL